MWGLKWEPFSGRKKPVFVILIKNQRASIQPSQEWVTFQRYTTHMVIYLLKMLPGGKEIQMSKGSHQKYCLIMYGVSPFNLIYREPKRLINSLKEATQWAACQQSIRGVSSPVQAQKSWNESWAIKWSSIKSEKQPYPCENVSDQMILQPYHT